jgi:hypothetical protein
VVTLWFDPERELLPRLLRTRTPIPDTRTVFVHRSRDSVTILAADSAGTPLPRLRLAVDEVPTLFTTPIDDGDLTEGKGLDGVPSIAAVAYIPRLRWYVYRVIARDVAYAPFRRQVITETALAFALGSFVIGTTIWLLRNRREQRIRVELMQARLEGLEAQLRPHLLFNSLNAIATLVRDDPDAADAMLLRLADLLRLSLQHSADPEVPLRTELELFDAYIALERVRFGDALRVERRVAPDVLGVPVPRWILQPLVENAIKHGATYCRGVALVELTVSRDGDHIVLVLGDNGPRRLSASAPDGVGLSNTRRRLATLYGPAASLALRARDGGGVEAVVRIPARGRVRAATPVEARERMAIVGSG